MLTDGLEWYGLLVDYCGVFISCLDSHSDGTHSLQRIHWWASDVMLHFSKSDEETNLSTSSLAWVYFHQILNVWVNYSFKFKIICFNMDVVLPCCFADFWEGFLMDAGTRIQCFALVQTQTSLRSGMFLWWSLAYCFSVVWPVHKSFHFFVDHILCTGAFPADLIFLCIWTTLGCILD